ncbi:MAG TPA: hypothetical protein VF032_11710 [Thermoleophilaceae bacterium]
MSDDERQERQEDRALSTVMVGSIMGLAGVVAVLAIVAVVAVGNGGTSSARQAASPPVARATPPTPRTVTVAMHDPGCHWFLVGHNSFGKAATVQGPVVLANNDEAALNVAGPSGTKTDPIGGKISLAAGRYHITMVGQAPDDNHLKLVVN